MNNDEFITLIKEIGKDVLEEILSKDMPPYPRYYQELFIEKLNKNSDSKVKSFMQKYSYLFDSSKESEKYVNDCFSIAKKSILHYQHTNSNIESLSEENKIDPSLINLDFAKHNIEDLIEAFSGYQSHINEEIEKAKNTIKDLKKEISKLEKESMLDPLTKLYNRAAFEKELEEILEYGLERDLDCGLILIDVDDFKLINDNYGHIAGDKTLIYLAKLMQSSVRRGTRVYRIGGEEFVVIVNRATKKDVIMTAKRLLTSISDSKLYYKSFQIRITASIGVAFHEKADTVDNFLNRADIAMYRAKKYGKNRVEIADAN